MTRSRWPQWAGAFALVVLGGWPAAADDPIELTWDSLLPAEVLAAYVDIDNIFAADPNIDPLDAIDPMDMDVLLNQTVETYNGNIVRLAGFVVPLDFENSVVREFLLVPYVGACIHVPPPPANQIVYVTVEAGLEIDGLFEPVVVTGVMQTTKLSTDMAEVGYSIVADGITPYVYQ